jgi:hypothetical protein
MAGIDIADPLLDPARDPLWHRIDAVDLDRLGGAYPFSARLAAENGWTESYAARVMEEYKRFCYLAVRAGHPVVPSESVDQAWHLHLGFSRHYWESFCAEALGMDLHHSPADNGDADDVARHRDLYAETLNSYQGLSGEVPPPDIWPAADTQFSDKTDRRRVNPRDYLIIRRPPKGLLWALQIALVFGALYCLWRGDITGALIVGAVTATLAIYRARTDNEWKTKPWRDGDDGDVGTGGCSSRGV